MSKLFSSLLVLTEGVGDRLRAARTRLGLKQSELADMGGVSRATQISYENSVTEPNTGYLRGIQPSQIDIGYVLFAHSKEQLDGVDQRGTDIDWIALQQAHEDVEFFCLKFAPGCPPKYRWKMVAELYGALQARSIAPYHDDQQQPDSLALISSFWGAFGKA